MHAWHASPSKIALSMQEMHHETSPALKHDDDDAHILGADLEEVAEGLGCQLRRLY